MSAEHEHGDPCRVAAAAFAAMFAVAWPCACQVHAVLDQVALCPSTRQLVGRLRAHLLRGGMTPCEGCVDAAVVVAEEIADFLADCAIESEMDDLRDAGHDG